MIGSRNHKLNTLIAAVIMVGLFVACYPLISSFDRTLRDQEFQILRIVTPRIANTNPVLIGIDDATINSIAEPIALWHRQFAAILRALRIAKPAAVGLDVVLPDRSFESFAPGHESELVRAIIEARRDFPLILAATVDPAGQIRSIHPPFVSAANSNIGLALWQLDADNKVRIFTENLGEHEKVVPSLVGQMARALGIPLRYGLIDFAYGTPFEYVSMRRVLELHSNNDTPALKRLFSGQIVLLGSVMPYEDRLNVPSALSAWEPQMTKVPGVVLHAQALRSLVDGKFVQQVPSFVVALLVILLGASLWRGAARPVSAATLAIMTPLALFAAACFLVMAGWSLDIGAPIVVVLLATGGRQVHEAWQNRIERRRLQKSFKGYVSPAVMDEILSGRLRPDQSGEPKYICVMFSDIRSFTTISERMQAQEVLTFLNRYFDRAVSIIHKHGGTVACFMGDGIMAIFGAPQTLANPCQSAFAASQELLDHAAKFSQSIAEEIRSPIVIGIGLHAGEAIVGHVGSADRHDYSAIGDVTNVASRLEGLTKETGYALICSREVAKEVHLELIDDLGALAIKGHTAIIAYGYPSLRPHADAAVREMT